MERKLNGIDEKEALRYLGCRQDEPPEELKQSVHKGAQTILAIARPKAVWRRFSLIENELEGTTFTFQGQDVLKHLAGCREVILMAATLGHEVEQLLLRSQVQDLSGALVLDCCASAAVESVCNDLEHELRQAVQQEGRWLTGRYSPGYGDFPLTQQPEVCQLLDTQRRIGLTLTTSGLMVPRKSVTAVMGISDAPVGKRTGGCETCTLRDRCQMRKGGRSCEQ